jgi:hypothetical protein
VLCNNKFQAERQRIRDQLRTETIGENMKIKMMVGVFALLLPMLLMLPAVFALPAQIPDVTDAEVVTLLNQVDTVVLPMMETELAKEHSLGVNVQEPVVVVRHIQQASEFLKSHKSTPFALYVLATNVNAAWYNLLSDAYRFRNSNPQESQELITVHMTIKPIADLASALAYRSIRNTETK